MAGGSIGRVSGRTGARTDMDLRYLRERGTRVPARDASGSGRGRGGSFVDAMERAAARIGRGPEAGESGYGF